MSVRLFHREARWVLVVRRRGPGDERWWSPHRRVPDWGAILRQQLALLALSAEAPQGERSLKCPLGQIHWTGGRWWSIMTLRLNTGSDRKRRLVAAALLKAARYARPDHRRVHRPEET